MRYIHAHIRSHFGSGAQTRRVAMPRPRTAGCLPDAFQEPRRSCSPHLVVGLLPAARSSSELLVITELRRIFARRRPASPSLLDASSSAFSSTLDFESWTRTRLPELERRDGCVYMTLDIISYLHHKIRESRTSTALLSPFSGKKTHAHTHAHTCRRVRACVRKL